MYNSIQNNFPHRLTAPGLLKEDPSASPSKTLRVPNALGGLNGSPGPVVVSGPDGTHVVLSSELAAFSSGANPPHTQADPIVGEFLYIFMK